MSASIAGATSAAADEPPTKDLTVDLSTVTGPATGVGQGILYGITEDGSQPGDEYVQPLNLNAFRGGGWFSGGWIRDGYTYGDATKAEVASIIAQAKRLRQSSGNPDFQYQVIVSDLFGSTGGAPANTLWPCTDGDCSNWLEFIDTAVGALEESGIDFAYDIFNEPDLSIFWRPGVNTPQYFQMWDSAYAELRRVAPDAKIVGPSFAFTPERNPGEWATFFAHVKAANTVPDWITNHDEGDVDDPVTVAQSLRDALDAADIPQRPLSANEYQPADRQSAGVTAWYLARFAQSTYANAMRGNWSCCMVPNLTGLLTHAQTGWAPTGNWWASQTNADMTGSLVKTSGQVGSMAISAAKDPSKGQAVALLGDANGYTGTANVTFTGLGSAAYLVRENQVHATVYRMPDGGALYSKQVQSSGDFDVAADGSVSIPVRFQGSHDAIAVYLSWTRPQTVSVQAPDLMVPGGSYDVPVVFTNGSASPDTQVQTSLAVTAENPADAAGITVDAADGGGSAAPIVHQLGAGESTIATFRVEIPASAPNVAYRLVATTNLVNHGHLTVSDSADVIAPCALGVNCEAENGQLAAGACLATDHPGYTGAGFVACFTSPGPSVTQQFAVPADGTYTLDLRYAAGPNGPNSTRSATVTANGVSQQVQLPLTGSWNRWGDSTVALQLKAGRNDITVSYLKTDLGWFNLDHLVLTQ
ncbi:CBM35 domain-containing protein [Xylanimonas sp. McL0601]|uniref:CBM35 domain-containing protein n=1 Tax=Xylanimonas sp. McL0601 TaxID=3414739 RepID=UPI003CE67DA1